MEVEIRTWTCNELTEYLYELNNIFCRTMSNDILLQIKYIQKEIIFRQSNCTKDGYIDIGIFV